MNQIENSELDELAEMLMPQEKTRGFIADPSKSAFSKKNKKLSIRQILKNVKPRKVL
jgi:hypothetical protein